MPLATHSWLHSLLTASDDHEVAAFGDGPKPPGRVPRPDTCFLGRRKVKVKFDEEGVPRRKGVPVCCNPSGIPGRHCLQTCRTDPRFMKSKDERDAEQMMEAAERQRRSKEGSSRGGAGNRPGSEGYADRFVGANGEYNPFGRHFPAPPAPPRKPGFWPWLDAKKSLQELAKGSPNPQYYLTNWIDRVNHMNFLGWVDGPTDVRPGIVSNGPDDPLDDATEF